ncbi:DUF4440 domain-containing protein [Pseudoroseicyclus tamaricis]|uniref:Nuclear transport factor 2 family protein n=1 Tax=Pseudoroseicyclus tamaricis TaxID=2705421 RepID=A0A6B2JSB0_9RHOB|nr:DUF4440 domain-containing protein [Pseudoroseicyclus tamaricis]NDV00870.1 nuclear transport factor 2 family protein [Pseudoroseicyclus tamaricis]
MVLDGFLKLERQVWEALVAGDAAADAALLAEEFLGVYSSGFSDRAGHAAQLEGGPSVADYRLSEARLMELGPGRVLLAYLATFRKVGEAREEAMYVSSIWEERGGTWLNVFSQDSSTADPAPV